MSSYQLKFTVSIIIGLIEAVVNVIAIWRCEDYQIAALNRHNMYRAKHGSPDMVLDKNLNDLAEQCAKYYTSKCVIDHSCPHKAGAGENLIQVGGPTSQMDMAVMASDSWYSEESKYDYNKPGFSMETGHFTQIVWKSSTRFGFGAVTDNGCTIGVGLYSPHGNMQGDFQNNVFKPK